MDDYACIGCSCYLSIDQRLLDLGEHGRNEDMKNHEYDIDTVHIEIEDMYM